MGPVFNRVLPNCFGLTESEEVGDTGLEPVTPSLSSQPQNLRKNRQIPGQYRDFSRPRGLCKPLHTIAFFLGKKRYFCAGHRAQNGKYRFALGPFFAGNSEARIFAFTTCWAAFCRSSKSVNRLFCLRLRSVACFSARLLLGDVIVSRIMPFAVECATQCRVSAHCVFQSASDGPNRQRVCGAILEAAWLLLL